MKNKIIPLFIITIFCSSVVKAQVPVSEEPRHKPVLQNKYIRILDVWVQPGDTTLFHIHATPSLFVHLSNNVTGSQAKGEAWVKDQSETGKAWYRSFSPDTLIHRVTNLDMIPFHVNDIEILASYNGNNLSNTKPLPFTLLFENEKASAYRVTNILNNQIIKDRGPIIAELATGEGIIFHDVKTNQSKEIKAGNYLYIEPGSSFYFTTKGKSKINMVLFEIK